jgi:threonine/homoserine/homoserine lactone efflux protein
VISETLRHDIGAGIRVAIAPLITDIPLILFTLLILRQLSEANLILGLISLTGAVFLSLLGYESLRAKGLDLDRPQPPRRSSVLKGALANVLSPYPYLFWFTVGGPLMTKSMSSGIAGPLSFVVTFYLMLVGSKVLLAVLVGRSKHILHGRVLVIVLRVLGVLLILLAIQLLGDGLTRLGLWPGPSS